MPFSIKSGISTANHGDSWKNRKLITGLKKINKSCFTPRAIACAIPNFGTFLAHNGLKWSVKQIFPPLYIFAVFPSNSGSAISGAVPGYVIGICKNKPLLNFKIKLWFYDIFIRIFMMFFFMLNIVEYLNIFLSFVWVFVKISQKTEVFETFFTFQNFRSKI